MGLICFDLDGTLVDPLRAISHCVQLTCSEFGLPVPDQGQIAGSIGCGAAKLFGALPGLELPARLDPVLERYWEHFGAEAIVKYRIYDGILLMLARLKRQGHQIYAVTVQPVRYARQVLHQFDLLLSFDDVFGGSPQDPCWCSKAEVIAQLRAQGILQPGGFLVGDRAEDMAVARIHGLVPLGVGYGYGLPADLLSAGAERVFDSVADLDEWLKERWQDPEIHDSFSRSE